MAVQLVQSLTLGKAGTSVATVSTSAAAAQPTLNNWMFVWVWGNAGTGGGNLTTDNFHVTDQFGNFYQPISFKTAAQGFSFCGIWAARITSTGDSLVVTVTKAVADSRICIAASEFSGTAGVVQNVSNASGPYQDNPFAGSVAVGSGALLLACMNWRSHVGDAIIGTPSGWTQVDTAIVDHTTDPGGTYQFGQAAYRISTGPGFSDPIWPITSPDVTVGDAWLACQVAVLPAPFANASPLAMTDGVRYATASALTASEADIANLVQPPQVDPLGLISNQVAEAIVTFSAVGVITTNTSYVVMQTDLGDGHWIDVAWCQWAGITGTATFSLSAGEALANAFQQTRVSGDVPDTVTTFQDCPLGGRLRLVGAAVSDGPITVDANVKLLPIRTNMGDASGGSRPPPHPTNRQGTRHAPGPTSLIRSAITILGPTPTPVSSGKPPPVFVTPLGAPTAQVGWDTFAPDLSAVADTSMTLSNLTLLAQPLDGVVAFGDEYTAASALLFYGQTTSLNATFQNGTDNAGLGGNVYMNGNLLATKLPVVLPTNSLYLAWPVNVQGTGTPLVINRARLDWCRDDTIGNTWAIAGDTISIFGVQLSNLADPTKTWIWLVRDDDATDKQFVASTSVNPYKVQFTLPAVTAGKTYRIYCHNGHGGSVGWSDYVTLNATTVNTYAATFGRLRYDAKSVNLSVYTAIHGGAADSGNDMVAAYDAARAALQAASPLHTPGTINWDVAGTYNAASRLNSDMPSDSTGVGADPWFGILNKNTSGGTVLVVPHSTFSDTQFIIGRNGTGAMDGINWNILTGDLTNMIGGGGHSPVTGIWYVNNCVGDSSNYFFWTYTLLAGSQEGTVFTNNDTTGWGFFATANQIRIQTNTFRLAQETEAPFFGQDNKYLSYENNAVRDKTDVGIYSGSLTVKTGTLPGAGSLTMETGLNWVNGTAVVLKQRVVSTDPNYGATLQARLVGTVSSYNSGTGATVFSITSVATLTGAFANGGIIRIFVFAGKFFTTGDSITITGAGGSMAVNGTWTVTKIDDTTLDLQGSDPTGTYTSGGAITTATIANGTLTGGWVVQGSNLNSGSGRICWSTAGSAMFWYVGTNTSHRLVSGNAVGKSEQIGLTDGSFLSGTGQVAASPAPTTTSCKLTGVTVNSGWVTFNQVVCVSGTGVTQARLISAVNTLTNEISWVEPLEIVWDTSSKVNVVGMPMRTVIYNNTLESVYGLDFGSTITTRFAGGCHNIIDANQITNATDIVRDFANDPVSSNNVVPDYNNLARNNVGITVLRGIKVFSNQTGVGTWVGLLARGGNVYRNNTCSTLQLSGNFLWVQLGYTTTDGRLMDGDVWDGNIMTYAATGANIGVHEEHNPGNGLVTLIFVNNAINGNSSSAQFSSGTAGFDTAPASVTSQFIGFTP